METIGNKSAPLWLLHNAKGRRLLISLLKLEPAALAGTKFQFLPNHPLIRCELDHLLATKSEVLELSGAGTRQRHTVLMYLKYLLQKKSVPNGG
jgi:hypothetical protein